MWVLMKVLLLSTVAAVVGTGLGGFAGSLIRRNDLKAVSLMLSFAGGLMLSVVCLELLPEALLSVRDSGRSGLYRVLLGIICGYGSVGLLSGAVCQGGSGKRGRLSAMLVSGLVLCAAIALHNFPEGMVIGSACAIDGETALGYGLIMAAVLGLHNIPEGMAVGVSLTSGGMGRAGSVLLAAASGLPSVLGALLGWYMGSLSPELLAMSLSFSAGAMLYVVLAELLPEGNSHHSGKAPAAAAFVGVLLGLLICRI